MITHVLTGARSGHTSCALLICVAMLLLLTTGCNDDNKPLETAEPTLPPAAAAVDPGTCLSSGTSALSSTDSEETCVTFSYDVSSSVLSLTHTNVVFNCCPYQILFDVDLEGNQLTITEYEDSSLCDCTCLFDVEFSITNLVPGDYHVVIKEQYQPPAAEAINFDLVLAGDTTGTHCFQRETGADSAAGSLLSYSDCKSMPASPDLRTGQLHIAVSTDTSADYSCIAYSYDGTDLTLEHINAGFNCCPDSLFALFEISGSTIKITESESLGQYGGCMCLCLYDLSMIIENLPPGVYSFEFVEPYWNQLEARLEFSLDLTEATEGVVCVERSDYPWGTVPE